MVVVAKCSECGDEHPHGDRQKRRDEYDRIVTTTCPACGADPYSSTSTAEPAKPEVDRIRDAVVDCDGVGKLTLQSIQTEYSTYVGLESATVAELAELEHVGQQTAEAIVEAVCN